MGVSGEIITADELGEIYRIEKKSGSLMTIRSDFFKTTAELLKQLRADYDKILAKDPDSPFCEGINNRRKRCIRMSKEIVEIRMGKICKMALRGAMGATNSLESLTPEEKEYYDRILETSKIHKSLLERQNGAVRYPTLEPIEPIPIPAPAIETANNETEVTEPQPEPVQEIIEETPETQKESEVEKTAPEENRSDGEMDLGITPDMGDVLLDEPEGEQDIPEDELDKLAPSEEAEPKTVPIEDPDFLLIRALKDIPEIAWKDRNYTLKNGDVARIPVMLAQALINRELAERISVSA